MPGPYYENIKQDDIDVIAAADLNAIQTGFENVDKEKANKTTPATAGNFAALAGDGELLDSGKAQPSGELVGTSDAQSLSNKTLVAATLTGVTTASGTLNITGTFQIGGATVSATAAQINKLNGMTASQADLNILSGANSAGVTASNIAALANVSGAIQGHVAFTANGAITAGDPVILEAAGTVRALSANENLNSGPIAPLASGDHYDICYDPDGNVVIAAYNSGNDLIAVAGTVSGGTITWGTPQTLGTSAGTIASITCDYDQTADAVVFVYRRSAGSPKPLLAYAATLAGTVFTFGAEVEVVADSTDLYKTVYCPSATRACFLYRSTSTALAVGVIAVSGTTVSLAVNASASVAISAAGRPLQAVYDTSADKLVIALQDTGVDTLFATVSPSAVTYSSKVGISNSQTAGMAFDSNINACVLGYRNTQGDDTDVVRSVTVGPASPILGTPQTVTAAGVEFPASAEDSAAIYDAAKGHVVMFADNDCFTVTWSGETAVFSDPVQWNATTISDPVHAVYDPDSQGALVIFDNAGPAVRFLDLSVATDVDDYAGIAQTTVADTESVSIALKYQVSAAHTGLTPGTEYWFGADGALLAYNSGYAKAGRALSATSLQVGS